MDMSWVSGFLTGVGLGLEPKGVDPLNNTDFYGVAGWIDNYCGQHPIDPIVKAAMAFATAHPH